MENQLVELCFSGIDSIVIPTSIEVGKRQCIVGKMLIALKGNCDFKNVDSLTIMEERIRAQKYSEIEKVRIYHPAEIEPRDYPQKVTYEFPEEETWSEIMKLMGVFTNDESDNNRLIRICRDNIDRTIRYMNEDRIFHNDIISAMKVYRNISDEEQIINYASSVMERMVIAHELGHMVFRSIRNDLPVKERESLANWFSCLFADEMQRKMISLLTPYQSEEYKDFIEIPEKYKLKKRQYAEYCKKLEYLLRSW